MLIVSWFICGMLYFFLYSYLFSTMVCKEKFKLDKRCIISIVIMGVLNLFLLYKNIAYIKPYVMHFASLILLKWIYKEKFIKTLIGTLFIFILSFASEFIFGMTGTLIFKINFSLVNSNFIYYLLSNVIISLICYMISVIPFVRSLVDNTVGWYSKNEYKSLVFFVLLVLILLTFVLYNNFISILPPFLLLIANLFFAAVFIFVIGFFKEKSNNNKIIYEYDQLLDYIKTYEQLLDEKSKNQHEYKNQLSVIRMMAKNKKTIEYIDSLLENETEENLEVLNKLKYIPKGGLKGLIYYKIETMKKKKLNIFIDVSSELRESKLWNKCDKNLQSISKILGVYLDNAIEACEKSKEKYIIFEVFLEDKNIVFKISNTFSNEINMDKIDNEGYTTKGKGKGYGLALVKDLIEKNDYLSQDRTISGIYYIQKLYIKK